MGIRKAAHLIKRSTADDDHQGALSPEKIARQVEQGGIAKARAGVVPTVALAVMAGVFIGLGGVLAGTIAVGSDLGIGPTRLLMGLGLTMALFMVVITGAELFTGKTT